MTPTFGIDLGTTKSAIGWVADGVPTLLPVDGHLVTPSVVHLPRDGAPVVGAAAIPRLADAPDRTFRSTKRHMGADVTWDIDGRAVTPVDVAALVLRHLARGAELTTGHTPRRVVITVPAWFSVAQRADTRRAGELAGLDVVRLLNEPTAAALAHDPAGRRRVLVYDFGGGTFDASLVDEDGGLLEVRASHGDTHLGGDDVDDGLVEVLLDAAQATTPGAADALRASPSAMARLRQAAEAAKRALCAAPHADVHLRDLVRPGGAPLDLDHRLGLADLEHVVLPLLQRTLACVDATLASARRTPAELDAIVLVGGSTALPLVWRALHKRYGVAPTAAVDPRRAVALGAAVQAGLIDGVDVRRVLVDVAPYPLAIGMATGGVPGFPTHFVAEVVTPRNAPLPATHTVLVRTNHPTQDRLRIPVYQGDDPDPRRDVMLGEIVMNDLPPAPIDEISRPIAVTFHHDLSGQVRIVVTDELTGMSVDGVVAADGKEQAELRQRWEDFARAQDLAFGDPYLARADALLPVARALFDQVTSRAAELRDRGVPHLDELLRHVFDGQAALRAGDVAAATAAYEDLQDDLFEAGVWW